VTRCSARMRRVHYPGWSVLDGFKLKDRNVTMLLPELVESHWYYYLLIRTPDIVPLKPVRFFDPATVACDLENTLANRNRKLEKADRFWFAPE
jgi:hypothetical protein